MFTANIKIMEKLVKKHLLKDIKCVDRAVNILKNGGVVALPTDTVYGLACDATNSFSIEKLYKIKERNLLKPLTICLGNINEIGHYALVKNIPQNSLEELLPGAVTIILKTQTKNSLDKSLICDGKIGVRVPNSEFIRTVASELGAPLALTSANKSNEPSTVNINEFRSFWNELDGVFDGGILSGGRSGSTIVDLSESGHFWIVREGCAHLETCKVLEKYGLKRN